MFRNGKLDQESDTKLTDSILFPIRDPWGY